MTSAPAPPSPTPTDPAANATAGSAAWYAVAVLVLVTLYSFVDRQVFVLQAQPIKEQLGLSDLQLGLLQGVGVALFAAVAGYPLGWLADRFERRLVLCLCVLAWSASVAACGFADGFNALFIAGAMVGAAEAGLTPITFALIPALFQGRQRFLANSTFAIATRLGIGLAIAFCGQLVHWVELARPWLPPALQAMEGWRLTFLAAALPAPVMLLLILSIRLPRHLGTAPDLPAAGGAPAAGTRAQVGEFLRANARTFVAFFGGIGLAVFGFASIISWVPAITMRMYGDSATQAGNATGSATLIATVIGFAFSWWGVRLLEPWLGRRLPMVVLWTATLSAAITTVMLLWTSSAMQIYVLQGVQMAFVMAGIMLYPTALQNLCPAHLRSRIVALNGIVSAVCGALSPPAVGALSDALAPRADALLLAAVAVAGLSLMLSGLLLWWGTDSYEATVRSAEACGG